MINCLHHFEILTNSSKNLLNYFVNGFKFKLVLSKNTGIYEQYLINSNSINFLITSLSQQPKSITNSESHPFYHTSLLNIEQADKCLYDLVLDKKNTVFNAAFQVRDLDKILLNCKNHNVKIIKDKHELIDKKHGLVQCAIIKSCVDGVTHSLFDLKNYTGKFLPGYEISSNESAPSSMKFATHFDHLTYATHKNTSKNLIEWYKNIFNMKYFRINGENDENGGLNVRTGSSGMNIKAIKYWLCAETGVEFDKPHATPSSESNSFKFVISEPLEGDNDVTNRNSNKNQISIFLDEHNGPGIQHIGLHTPDIFKSVKASKENCNQIKYYVTPDSYYQSEEKKYEIKKCGLNVDLLKENHVLLDAELEDEIVKNLENVKREKEDSGGVSVYLLQVFTQPIFEKNTLFLELIQRVGDAHGFGAANIKALWNAVQYQINNKITK